MEITRKDSVSLVTLTDQEYALLFSVVENALRFMDSAGSNPQLILDVIGIADQLAIHMATDLFLSLDRPGSAEDYMKYSSFLTERYGSFNND